MKTSVEISRGIESLFGTRDENIRVLEEGLSIQTRLLDNSLELEGEETSILRAEDILGDYVALTQEGHKFTNGDLNNCLQALVSDPNITLKRLVETGKKRSFGKKMLAPKSMNQRLYLDAIEHHDMVFGIGPAGTGKTYLAMAQAMASLLDKEVSRVILARPAVEAGEKLGFLPGDLQQMVDPYLRPLYDALYDLLDFEKVERLFERNQIEVAPIAFMRGRTLSDAFVIIDEAQNTTTEQMKMVLTRVGPGSKVVVTGDITQIDLPSGRVSGLVEALSVLSGVEGIAFRYFDEKDVVRHRLVQSIIQAYEAWSGEKGRER
jgi:phosphate starvation-inducible PhoH-like protein